jgi:cysteine desulfurase
LLAAFDLNGFCLSAGSACSAGSLTPSHVLSAMGFSNEEAASIVRISLGRETRETDIDRFLSLFPLVINQIRNS